MSTNIESSETVPEERSAKNPWWFVPSLYFMQGIPVVIVQTMSVVMYKTLGVDNARIGLWTSIIAFPWVAKMLWGPLVDSTATKRSWILSTQPLILVGLLLTAFGVTQESFLPFTLGVFFIVAFLSASHDIAADGFYLLALSRRDQAAFVGFRSLFFRLAAIFATGGLVALAGRIEKTSTIQTGWMVALLVGAGAYGLGWIYNLTALPKPVADPYRDKPDVAKLALSFGQILLMIAGVFLLGRLVVIAAAWLNSTLAPGRMIVTPPDNLTPLFLPAKATQASPELAGNFLAPVVTPISLQWLIWGMLLWVSWMATRSLFGRIGLGPAAREYFSESRIWAILGFILFYRLGESLIGGMSAPFLLDPQAKGGLGLDTETVGHITGTLGVIGLALGGIAGGLVISRFGIKRTIWPMVLSLNIPNFFYIYAAIAQPGVATVGALIAIDQFGYGFGFSAYMVYLMFIAQGSSHQTSHYAISTGLMALGAQFARALSGYLQTALGYRDFFIAVLILGIPGMLMLLFLPMDRKDLKVRHVDLD